eukprot:4232181-Amphidinium_carterae.2
MAFLPPAQKTPSSDYYHVLSNVVYYSIIWRSVYWLTWIQRSASTRSPRWKSFETIDVAFVACQNVNVFSISDECCIAAIACMGVVYLQIVGKVNYCCFQLCIACAMLSYN